MGVQRSPLVPQFVGGLQGGLQAQGLAQRNRLLGAQADEVERKSALTPQVNALRTRALTDPNALQQLAALSPESAQEILRFQQGQATLEQNKFSTLDARRQSRIRNVTQGALQLASIPTKEGKIRALEQRLAQNAKAGVDSNETNEVLALFNQGRDDEANALINQTVQFGERLGLIKAGARPQIKEGLTPEGAPGFFAVTPGGARQIPGITPAPRQPLVQIGQEGEKAEQKELAKLRAQDLAGLRARADEAEQTIQSLDVLDAIQVRTGQFEPFKQSLASWAEGVGIDASAIANVPAGQAFQAEAGKLVLRVLATQKGPQTDNDRRAIAKTITRLGNSPEANIFIQDVARAQARRTIEERNFKDEWLAENGTTRGSSQAWSKKKRNIPMVTTKIVDENGLPSFFFKFKEAILAENPEASDADIIETWKSLEAQAR